MAFKPIKFDSGKVMNLPLGNAAVATKHSRMKMSSGYLVAGATDDDESEYIALETTTDATASDGGTYVNVLPIDGTIVFEALVGATPVQATHVGNDYGFTDADTVNFSDTTDKAFHVDSIVSATNKLVIGRFNRPSVA